jgi:hypothetical protein
LLFRFISKFAAMLVTPRSNSASLRLIFMAMHHLVSFHYSLILRVTWNNVVQNVLTAFTTLLWITVRTWTTIRILRDGPLDKLRYISNFRAPMARWLSFW